MNMLMKGTLFMKKQLIYNKNKKKEKILNNLNQKNKKNKK